MSTKTKSGKVLTSSEEIKYRKKYKDLKRKVRNFEAENARIGIKLEKAKTTIQRLRLERSFLYEKLEQTNGNTTNGEQGNGGTGEGDTNSISQDHHIKYSTGENEVEGEGDRERDKDKENDKENDRDGGDMEGINSGLSSDEIANGNTDGRT